MVEEHRAQIFPDDNSVRCSCGWVSRSYGSWDEMVDAWDGHLPKRSPYAQPSLKATVIFKRSDASRAAEIIARRLAA